MVKQNKIFSLKVKRQAKNVFPRDVEWTVKPVFNVAKTCYFPEILLIYSISNKDKHEYMYLNNECCIH